MTFVIFIAVVFVVLALASAFGKSVGDTSIRGDTNADVRDIISSPFVSLGNLLVPKNETRRLQLLAKMQQAGLYQRDSSALFLGVYATSLFLSIVSAIALILSERIASPNAWLLAAIIILAGVLFPLIWLKSATKSRQQLIRRALADALDIIVICIQGGLSLPLALERVSRELRDLHPLFAQEMEIVHREVHLGTSAGEGLRRFANRFDAAELQALASVVVHAQKYGAALGPTLQTYAEDLRLERKQAVETMAQKSAVKLVFPIAFCIFPAFILIAMGPSLVDIVAMMSDLGKRM